MRISLKFDAGRICVAASVFSSHIHVYCATNVRKVGSEKLFCKRSLNFSVASGGISVFQLKLVGAPERFYCVLRGDYCIDNEGDHFIDKENFKFFNVELLAEPGNINSTI